MSTQLFMHAAASDYSTGNNDTKLNGSASGWTVSALSLSRGPGVGFLATSTVDGATDGIEVVNGSTPMVWISPPLDADVTISGSITWNLRAAESSMSANAAINGILEKIDGATGAITLIDKTARVTELGTSEAAVNFAETPAAGVACKRGDRLRVRVFADDAGTMAGGFTFTFWWDGTTAGASGDSYLTLTETLSFVSEPAGTTIYPTDTSAGLNGPGDTGFKTGTATNSGAGTAWSNLGNIAASDDAYTSVTTASSQSLKIQSLGISIPDGAYIVGVEVTVEHVDSGGATNPLYHLQLLNDLGSPIGVSPSLAIRGSEGTDTVGGPTYLWGAESSLDELLVEDANFGVSIRCDTEIGNETFQIDRVQVKVYYDTALPSIAREAWTARGAGVQSDTCNSIAGWTAPLQLTDAADGRGVEWYTKPIQAVTLGGAVRCNIRAREATTAVNASIRAEVAVVDGDGTFSAVWAAATFAAELTASEAAQSFLVSGDDLAVTDGQRLRIRIYLDDSPGAAMAASLTGSIWYAGTSGGASGDTYFTFTQTLAEFASNPAPGPIALTLAKVAPTRIDQEVSPGPFALATAPVAPEARPTVNPDAFALTSAAVAPTRMDQTAPIGVLALTGAAVAPRVDQRIDPAALARALAIVAPTRMDQDVSPGPAARSFVLVAPTTIDQVVSPTALARALAIVAFDRLDQEASPAALSLTLATVAPTQLDQEVRLAAIALVLAAIAPTSIDVAGVGGQTISPTALALAIAAVAPTQLDQTVPMDALALAIAEVAPQVDLELVVPPVPLTLAAIAPTGMDQTLALVALALVLTEIEPTAISFPQTVSPATLALILGRPAPQVNLAVSPAALSAAIAAIAPTRMDFTLDLINIALALSRPAPEIQGGVSPSPRLGADPWWRRQPAPIGPPIEAWSLYTSLIARYGLAEGRQVYERMLAERKGPFAAGAKYDPERPGSTIAVPHIEIPKARRD